MITGWYLVVFMNGAAFLHMENLDACKRAAYGFKETRLYAACVNTNGEVSR